MTGFSFEQLDEDRSGQMSLRLKLTDARAVYPLMEAFRSAGVELLDFHQEQPTLEDVFLSITGDEGAA